MNNLRSKPSNLVQTIERVSLILDILSNSTHGISVGELSEKTGFPKGTTHRLLTSAAYFDLVRTAPEMIDWLGRRLDRSPRHRDRSALTWRRLSVFD